MATSTAAEQLKQEIARVRSIRCQAEAQHMVNMEAKERVFGKAQHKLNSLESRLAMHRYVDAMQEANDGKVCIYAAKKQAAMCQTLHRIEVQTKQLQLAKKHYDELRRSLFQMASKLDEDRMTMEKFLLNRIADTKIDIASLQEKKERLLWDQHRELAWLAPLPEDDDLASVSSSSTVPVIEEVDEQPRFTGFLMKFDRFARTKFTTGKSNSNASRDFMMFHRRANQQSTNNGERTQLVANVA